MTRTDDPRDAWARIVVGRWLRRWRHETGATQRLVAQMAGIDQSYLSRVERGHRRPSGEPLGRLILALDWLSGGGLRDGPYAGMRFPLPQPGEPVGGHRPPPVIGSHLHDHDRPLVPASEWREAQKALERDRASRTSRMHPPTLEEALEIRARRVEAARARQG